MSGKPFEKGNKVGRWFKPGQSGNPGGKPREVAQVLALLREGTEAAVQTLFEVMTNKDTPSAARVAAATAWLDRALGKPSQSIALTHENTELKDLTDAQLLAIIATARSDGSGSTPGTEEDPGQPH